MDEEEQRLHLSGKLGFRMFQLHLRMGELLLQEIRRMVFQEQLRLQVEVEQMLQVVGRREFQRLERELRPLESGKQEYL